MKCPCPYYTPGSGHLEWRQFTSTSLYYDDDVIKRSNAFEGTELGPQNHGHLPDERSLHTSGSYSINSEIYILVESKLKLVYAE